MAWPKAPTESAVSPVQELFTIFIIMVLYVCLAIQIVRVVPGTLRTVLFVV
jgi:hypothetical protein